MRVRLRRLPHNNTRRVWRGLHQITNYNGNSSVTVRADASLAEELNSFFAHFEASRPLSVIPPLPLPTTSTISPPTLQVHQVKCALRSVNLGKAAGPDGVFDEVLKACADQLSGALTRIFNLSLTQASIPSCLKSATIIPVPKKSPVRGLNDCRAKALTSVVMKCFEKLITDYIKASLPPNFDPCQFAFRANRSRADANATALHTALSHLEVPGNYVRMLFVDYSSTYNTITPDILVEKLRPGLPPHHLRLDKRLPH